MTRSLTVRLTLAIVAIMTVTLALTTALNFAKFNAALAGLEQERYGVLLFDLRDTVERSLRLGASLSTLRNTPDAMARLRQVESRIRAVTVFDEAGRVLFSTAADAAGGQIPADWAERAKSATGPVWDAPAGHDRVIGTALRNALGKPVGGVALQVDRRDTIGAAAGVLDLLVRHAVVAAAVLAVLAALAFTAYLRRFTAMFERITAWLQPRAAGAHPVAAPMRASNAIEQAVVAYCRAVDAHGARVDDALAAVRRSDP